MAGSKDEDLAADACEMGRREVESRGRRNTSYMTRLEKAQDSHKESFAVAAEDQAKADHALQRGARFVDTLAVDDHQDQYPYSSYRGRQHELERMLALERKPG